MSYFRVKARPGQTRDRRPLVATLLIGIAVAGVAALIISLSTDIWTPAAPAQLSYFEPHAGGCAWYRHDIASGEREQLAIFPTDCSLVRVAFSPTLDQAVVAFDADLRGEEVLDTLLFAVDLHGGKPVRRPLPEPGDARAYAFDKEGQLYAFTLDSEVEVSQAGSVLVYRGQTFARAASPDGTDAIAHTVLWADGKWRVAESVASRCCTAGALGIGALPFYKNIRADPKLAWLRREARHVPPETLQKARLAALPDFPFGARDPLEVAIFGAYLLVTEANTGMRATVYERSSSRRLFYGPHAAGASFWPAPAPTPSP